MRSLGYRSRIGLKAGVRVIEWQPREVRLSFLTFTQALISGAAGGEGRRDMGRNVE